MVKKETCQSDASAKTRTIFGCDPSASNVAILLLRSGVRNHPENARMIGRRRELYVAKCVACAALTLVVWQ